MSFPLHTPSGAGKGSGPALSEAPLAQLLATPLCACCPTDLTDSIPTTALLAQGYWVWGYALMVVGILAISVARSMVFFLSTLRAATRMHDAMLARLLRAPLAFFHTSPTGRILNRFRCAAGLRGWNRGPLDRNQIFAMGSGQCLPAINVHVLIELKTPLIMCCCSLLLFLLPVLCAQQGPGRDGRAAAAGHV